MTSRRPACSAVCSRPVPSWPAATSALREGSITNAVVASATKTHSHHRWPSLSSMSSNTCQLVSSACMCPAARPCAAIASAHGATCFSAPHKLPAATSNPSAASAWTIRCTGRPGTCFSYASRARNPAVNRPFGTGLGDSGAHTVFGPGCEHRRRQRRRGHTIRVIVTRQSICSLSSEPRNSNAFPHTAQHRWPASASMARSSVSRCE
jgi:hypothetical protein